MNATEPPSLVPSGLTGLSRQVVGSCRRCSPWAALMLAGFLVLLAGKGGAVPLTGANGTVVDFVGVKSAGPNGLRVQLKADGPLVDVGWDKFDLSKLEADNPEIFAAYQEAKAGKLVELDLGAFAPKINPADREMKNFADGAEKHGWYEVGAGSGKFAIQLPKNGDPKAILLLSMGQDGRSIRYIGGVGATRWAKMLEKFQMAVMAYEFPVTGGGDAFNPEKNAPFIFTSVGSGDAVIDAIDQFAEKSGKAVLKEAPIAVFGNDVLGAAFAYNFVQSHPERLLAAVISKGAFYQGTPTEASAKVPLLMLWGEFDHDIDRWQPTYPHDQAYAEALALKPHWVYAMEPRGTGGESPFSHQMGNLFLDRMILARLSPEGGIRELDPNGFWVGNLKTREISRMENPDQVLEPDQTWLPNGEIAKLWEDFSNGAMDLGSE